VLSRVGTGRVRFGPRFDIPLPDSGRRTWPDHPTGTGTPFGPQRSTDRWKIIEGIKFLCDNGLVLPGKDLAQEHIVITPEGQVKLCKGRNPFPCLR
jgi:hypothetical protein